jgi:hypothetical protein
MAYNEPTQNTCFLKAFETGKPDVDAHEVASSLKQLIASFRGDTCCDDRGGKEFSIKTTPISNAIVYKALGLKPQRWYEIENDPAVLGESERRTQAAYRTALEFMRCLADARSASLSELRLNA